GRRESWATETRIRAVRGPLRAGLKFPHSDDFLGGRHGLSRDSSSIRRFRLIPQVDKCVEQKDCCVVGGHCNWPITMTTDLVCVSQKIVRIVGEEKGAEMHSVIS